MTKQDLRIVFMGTPDFAVESLRILVENHYNVVGVITMPDKPAGRGHKLQPSAVKKYAVEQNLPLLQPEKLKDEAFLEALKAWQADLQIVVAFRMLPEVVWDMPRLGTFNLHASLLPQYRGAAPINWAIINGEKETGVTTFFLTHEIDTGKIIKQEKVAIGENDNAGLIHDKLMTVGARLVKETVDDLLAEKVEAIDQSQFSQTESHLKFAPKIFKETCQIDWTKTAQEVYNLIRGLSPYPAAWTELQLQAATQPQYFKIFETEIIAEAHTLAPSTVVSDFKTYLRVATADGFLELKSIQVPGKKAMSVGEFLRGLKI
jgi:methionyl-tRNA formyltransferase